MPDIDTNILLIIGGVIAAAIVITLIFTVCYKKCPPNKAMVITGPTGTSTVIGKAKIVIPFIQRVDYMSLENIQVDFTSRDEIPTKDAINILVDAVANMSIDQDPEVLKVASSKFLGYSIKEISKMTGCSQMAVKAQMFRGRAKLKELIQR